MSIGAIGLAFLAGILSILSPCVLPLLPLVLGAAASGTGSASAIGTWSRGLPRGHWAVCRDDWLRDRD